MPDTSRVSALTSRHVAILRTSFLLLASTYDYQFHHTPVKFGVNTLQDYGLNAMSLNHEGYYALCTSCHPGLPGFL